MLATTIITSTSNQLPSNSFISVPNSPSALFAGWGPKL
jgi:hypothetical protein